MTQSMENIKKRQREWAQRQSIVLDDSDHVTDLVDNLFEPLQLDAKSEYQSGAGDELQDKMRALHSSAALVCNFFHYWRYRDIGIIARACGLSPGYTGLTFECAYRKPRGIRGIRPHVDVEFRDEGLKPVAIEAKFTEVYGKSRKSLKEIYVRSNGVWGNYSGCQSLANCIVTGNKVFRYFDAPQLLKHILGLKTEYGERGFELLYLWYKQDGEAASKHENELARFEEYVVPEVNFRAMTYQETFQELKVIVTEHTEYLNYMDERYF